MQHALGLGQYLHAPMLSNQAAKNRFLSGQPLIEQQTNTRLRHNVWVFYDLPGSGTSSPEHLGMTMAKRLSRLRKP